MTWFVLCFPTKNTIIAKWWRWLLIWLARLRHVTSIVPEASISGKKSNYIQPYSVGCNILSLPEIPDFGTKVLVETHFFCNWCSLCPICLTMSPIIFHCNSWYITGIWQRSWPHFAHYNFNQPQVTGHINFTFMGMLYFVDGCCVSMSVTIFEYTWTAWDLTQH